MGDCQPPGTEERAAGLVSAGTEGPEYTCDGFTCGLCGLRTSSIESYVSHMVLKERCVLHLCPSGVVRDLLLPRFSKRQKRKNLEETETREETESVDQRRDGGGGDVEEEETKVEVQAEEVEMGDGRRWKCQVCGLTFSRQAAILNHFKLRHRVGSVPGESGEEVRHPEVKVEPVAPVKHIVTVEAKAGVGSLPVGATPSVKTWKELGCHLCGQAFKTGKILRTHISVVHSAGRPFPCGFLGCSFAFKTKGSLTRHERRHTGERPFACQHCGRRFRESGSLSRHLQSQGSCVNKSDAQIPLYGRTLPLQTHPAERKPSLPPDLKFNLKQELLSAEEEGRGEGVPALSPASPAPPLDESKAVVRSQIASVNHTVKMEESGAHSATHQLHVCKVEPPPPSPSTCLSPHPPPPTQGHSAAESIETAGEDEDIKPPHFLPDILRNSYTCPVCMKSYARRPFLALHLKQHLDELGERCSECHRRFTTRQALARHLASHSSLRQYECRVCGKTFKLLSHARTHLLAHTSAKSVPCRHCPNVYKTKSARNVHERTHTHSPAFPCQECRRAFTTKASLVRHLRTHSGEAPFCCGHCGRGFKEHGTLTRHQRHKVPCSEQARMARDLGDVGIHLLPPPAPPSPIKHEEGVARGGEATASDHEQGPELSKEREEEEGEWEELPEEEGASEDLGGGSEARFLVLDRGSAVLPTVLYCPVQGSTVEPRSQISSL